jgi:hypothetical protein
MSDVEIIPICPPVDGGVNRDKAVAPSVVRRDTGATHRYRLTVASCQTIILNHRRIVMLRDVAVITGSPLVAFIRPLGAVTRVW